MNDPWYYSRGRSGLDIVGPIPFQELVRLAAAGAIRPETPVRQGREGRWRTAWSVTGSQAAGARGAPPPANPPPDHIPSRQRRGVEATAGSRAARTDYRDRSGGSRVSLGVRVAGAILAGFVVPVVLILLAAGGFFGGRGGERRAELLPAELPPDDLPSINFGTPETDENDPDSSLELPTAPHGFATDSGAKPELPERSDERTPAADGRPSTAAGIDALAGAAEASTPPLPEIDPEARFADGRALREEASAAEEASLPDRGGQSTGPLSSAESPSTLDEHRGDSAPFGNGDVERPRGPYDVPDQRVALLRQAFDDASIDLDAIWELRAEYEYLSGQIAPPMAQRAELLRQIEVNAVEFAVARAMPVPEGSRQGRSAILRWHQDRDTRLKGMDAVIEERLAEPLARLQAIRQHLDRLEYEPESWIPTVFWLSDPLGRLPTASQQRVVELCRQRTQARPRECLPHLALAISLGNLGNLDESHESMEHFLREIPAFRATAVALHAYHLQRAADSVGSREHRVTLERRAHRLLDEANRAVGSPAINLLIGETFRLRGNTVYARRLFQQAIDSEPSLPQAHEMLARLLIAKTNPSEQEVHQALELATKACALTDWQDWLTLDTLAAAAQRADDLPLAIDCTTRAMEFAPLDYQSELQARTAALRAALAAE